MVDVLRTQIHLEPEVARVIARPFLPGARVFGDGPPRLKLIAERILGLPAGSVAEQLAMCRREFGQRHDSIESLWEDHARTALEMVQLQAADISRDRLLLLGAYFTLEYALEAAAVCNPSMAPAPEGGGRFILTLRAIGEGHISSVEFRTGSVQHGKVVLDEPAPRLTTGRRSAPTYSREEFTARLHELGPDPGLVSRVFALLEDRFSFDDLDSALSQVKDDGVSDAAKYETVRLIHWVATSNYEVTFGEGDLSGRVLTAAGPADSHGIEDVRLVRFTDDDGSVTYYGTYTAFDGFTILPQLIETSDFKSFRISTLSGASARNKGMAIFPRRVAGRYVALGRVDRESIFVMRSDRLRYWESAEHVYGPEAGWEMIQVGNCGPPIETERGWLVLTHGVGPMRRYGIGAILLDREHPERLVGSLKEPLLEPSPEERDGYVPNVVYSCGGMVDDGTLVLPYGFSDRCVGVATVELDELLDEITPL